MPSFRKFRILRLCRPSWEEVEVECEPGERKETLVATLTTHRRYKLVLELPPGFSGGPLQAELLQPSGVPLASERALVDYSLSSARVALEKAENSIRLHVDEQGESGLWGLNISSHSQCRRRAERFWLRLTWLAPPLEHQDALQERLFVVARSGFRHPASASAPASAPRSLRPVPFPFSPPAAPVFSPPTAPPPLTAPTFAAPTLPPFPPGAFFAAPSSAPPVAYKRVLPKQEEAPAPAKRPREDAAESPKTSATPPTPEPPDLEESFARLAVAAKLEAASASESPLSLLLHSIRRSAAFGWGALDAPSARPAPFLSRVADKGDDILEPAKRIIERVAPDADGSLLALAAAKQPSWRRASVAPADLIRVVDLSIRAQPLSPSLVPLLEGPRSWAAAPGLPPSPSLLRFPWRGPPEEAAALASALRGLHAAAAAAGTQQAADRLRAALMDVRVLATDVLQDGSGCGLDLRDMLQTIRAAYRLEEPVRSVLRFHAQALLAGKPEDVPSEDLADAARQTRAFLVFGSGGVQHTPADLWPLDVPTADALCARLLALARRADDPELRADAVVAAGMARQLYAQPALHEYLDRLYEAWGGLVRHRLVPSRTESDVMRQVLRTLLRLAEGDRGRHADQIDDVAERIYWCMGTPRDALAQMQCRLYLGYAAQSAGQEALARGHLDAICDVARALAPRERRLVSFSQVFALRAIEAAGAFRFLEALGALRELFATELEDGQWQSPAHDWVNVFRWWWPQWDPAKLQRQLQVLALVYKLASYWGETPHGAHIAFALGDLSALLGEHARAAACLQEALDLYARFDTFFPPDGTRQRAVRASLAAARAAAAEGEALGQPAAARGG